MCRHAATVSDIGAIAQTYDYHLVDAEWLKAQGRPQCLCYLFVQVTMPLDQFLAVFYLFKHIKLRSVLNRAMLALFVGLVTLFWLLQYVLPVLVIYQHILHTNIRVSQRHDNTANCLPSGSAQVVPTRTHHQTKQQPRQCGYQVTVSSFIRGT